MNKTNLILIIVLVCLGAVSLIMIDLKKKQVNTFTGIDEKPANIVVKNKFGDFNIDLVKKTINDKDVPEELIDTIKRKLDDIKVIRSLKEYRSLDQYGLEKPILEVSLEWPNRTLSLDFGNRNPHNQGIYAFFRKKVYIIDTFFFHEINKDLLNNISEVDNNDQSQ